MKRIMRTTGLLIVLMLAALSSQAQVSFGPRIGLNVSHFNYDYGAIVNDQPDSKGLAGAQIGLALNAQFGNLALQPALLFSMKGAKAEKSGSTAGSGVGAGTSYTSKGSTRYNYAEVPVNLVYSTKGAEGGFQVFAGPYVALGLSGKSKVENSVTSGSGGVTRTEKKEVDVTFTSEADSDQDKNYARNLDYGLNAGVGYKVGGVQVQLGYGLGLGNLIPKYDGQQPSIKVRNRNIQLALTYLFE